MAAQGVIVTLPDGTELWVRPSGDERLSVAGLAVDIRPGRGVWTPVQLSGDTTVRAAS